MKSSFVRKGKGADGTSSPHLVKELPVGCYPNTLNSNVLFASAGLHEVDDLVGGGVPVGGLLGLRQDARRHWKTLARYFASEGAAAGQGLVLVGARDHCPLAFARTDVAPPVAALPREAPVAVQPLAVDGVKIAWRYKAQLLDRPTLSGSEPTRGPQRCHLFDLTQSARLEPNSARVTSVLHTPGAIEATYQAVEDAVEAYNAAIHDPDVRNPPIVRILVLGLGSGLWDDDAEAIPRFVFRLRQLTRRSLATTMICMAASLPNVDPCFDISLQLTSFEGADPAFPGFDGTLMLGRTSSMFSTSAWQPPCRSFLFRRSRRSLHIERLYMPPEDRAQSDLACATTGGGGPGKALGLDF